METQNEAHNASRIETRVDGRDEPLAIGSQECEESSFTLSEGFKDNLKPGETTTNTRGREPQTNGEVVVNGVNEEEGKACPMRTSSFTPVSGTVTELLHQDKDDEETNFEVSELIKEILNQSSYLDEGLNGLDFVTGLGGRELEGQVVPLYLEGSEARSSTPDSDSNMRTASEGSSTPTSQLSVPSSTSSDNQELRIGEKDSTDDTKDSGVGCRSEESHDELPRQAGKVSEERDSSLGGCPQTSDILEPSQEGEKSDCGSDVALLDTHVPEGADRLQQDLVGDESSLTVTFSTVLLSKEMERKSPEQNSSDVEMSGTLLPQGSRKMDTSRIDSPGTPETPLSPGEPSGEEQGEADAPTTRADGDIDTAKVISVAAALENLSLSTIALRDQETEESRTSVASSSSSEEATQNLVTQSPAGSCCGDVEGEEPLLSGGTVPNTQADNTRREIQPRPDAEGSEEHSSPREKLPGEGKRQETKFDGREWSEMPVLEAARERLQEVGQDRDKASDVPTSAANSECVCKR